MISIWISDMHSLKEALMQNWKTCCLEQSDGQNFTLLYSQSNAETHHNIWSQESQICQSAAPLVNI